MNVATLEKAPRTAPSGKAQQVHSLELIARLTADTMIPLKPRAIKEMSDVVEGGLKYAQDNFEYSIQLNDIAAAAGLSKFHFIRKFHKEVGKTPGKFLRHCRIYAAMKQLTETSDPIAKIGKRVGYKDAAAFSRAFSRITGTQPRRFRQEAHRAATARNP